MLFGPRRIVATTRFVAGSMRRDARTTPRSATHTAPGVDDDSGRLRPATWMLAVTLFVAGSMRETVSSEG